jgi:hypothetical protein
MDSKFTRIGLRFRRRNYRRASIRYRAGHGLIAKLDVLERVLFLVFVAATNAFVAVNMGWVFLTASWSSILSGIVSFLSLATLGSFLAFAVLEDHLGSRRHEVDGYQP